jgi:hypothetical protein
MAASVYNSGHYAYIGRARCGHGEAYYVTDIPGRVGDVLPLRCSCGSMLALNFHGPWWPDGVGGLRPPFLLAPTYRPDEPVQYPRVSREGR